MAGVTTATARVAHLHARISAYLIDSVVLLGFILLFFACAGAILLFSSDLGQNDPADSAYYAFIGLFMGGTLVAWTAFNVGLTLWRGQSAGMYIVGIRMVGEDAPALTRSRALVRWFGLHPLLFHPFLLPVWALFSFIIVSLTLSKLVLVITLALVLLCVVSPVAGLATMLLDPDRRGLHDRLAGTLVVQLER